MKLKVMSKPEFKVASGVVSHALAVQTVIEKIFPRLARITRVLLFVWTCATVWAAFGIQAAVAGRYVYVGNKVRKREDLVRVEMPGAPAAVRSNNSPSYVVDTRAHRIRINHATAAEVAAFLDLPVTKYGL
jgi:hypothetical protein